MKKLLSLVLVGICFVSVSSAQSLDENFPDKGCKSQDVVYLEHSTTYQTRLFPVNKLKEELFGANKWKILTDYLPLAEEYKPVDPLVSNEKNGAAEWVFTSDHVIQRFDFGFDEAGKKIYKKYCVEFQEAIPVGPQGEVSKSIGGDSGLDLIKNYVSMVYKIGGALLGLACVLIIVISGIQISAGGADPSAIDSAKSRILQALLSLVMLFASAMILKAINPGFFL